MSWAPPLILCGVVCGCIRWSDKVLPILADNDGTLYFPEPVTGGRVTISGDIPKELHRVSEKDLADEAVVSAAVSCAGEAAIGVVVGEFVAGIASGPDGVTCSKVTEQSVYTSWLAEEFPKAPVDALAVLYYRTCLFASGATLATWANAYAGTEGAAGRYAHKDYRELLDICGAEKAWMQEFVQLG